MFVPDFVLRHDDGRAMLLQIVGFWTPEYLQAKFQTLRAFGNQALLLTVGKPATRQIANLPPGTIHFQDCLAAGRHA